MLVDVRQERLSRRHRHDLPDPRRADRDEVTRQVQLVGASPVVTALLDAADAMLLVLNPQRQVVAFNACRRDGKDLSRFAGLRPGEVLACANAGGPGGCGTTAACETCGALGAILACEHSGRSVEAECLITSDPAGASAASLELNVRATPVQVEGSRFTVVSLRDISGEKRRDALERIFFHDVLNTVAGLRGWAFHLQRPTVDLRRAGDRIDALSRQLEREISDHRSLVLAERGELSPAWSTVRVPELAQEIEGVFSHHAVARDRAIALAPSSPELALETDRALLLRVLINMVRNAFEATAPGGTVGLEWAQEPTGGARFTVRNEGFMPPEVQARVFQRSFSTKAPRGRGLGTYSMKLLGERYLGGHVSFASTPDAGTAFSIWLPLRPVQTAITAHRAGGIGSTLGSA